MTPEELKLCARQHSIDLVDYAAHAAVKNGLKTGIRLGKMWKLLMHIRARDQFDPFGDDISIELDRAVLTSHYRLCAKWLREALMLTTAFPAPSRLNLDEPSADNWKAIHQWRHDISEWLILQAYDINDVEEIFPSDKF